MGSEVASQEQPKNRRAVTDTAPKPEDPVFGGQNRRKLKEKVGDETMTVIYM